MSSEALRSGGAGCEGGLLTAKDAGFRVQGLGFRVSVILGLGFRVLSF